jgi:hypothetical protein
MAKFGWEVAQRRARMAAGPAPLRERIPVVKAEAEERS